MPARHASRVRHLIAAACALVLLPALLAAQSPRRDRITLEDYLEW